MVVLPTSFSEIPRCKLIFDSPTAIEKLERLSVSTPGVTLWVKREDCNSGLAMGGNKCRKLEYVLPDAISKGADTLVTIGGIQSNHMLQVAAAAARYGLRTSLIPMDIVDNNSIEYQTLGNVQLTRLMSAGHHPSATPEFVMNDIRERGFKPYFIPAGASDHPLGGLGFARWAFEVVEQERELNTFFDTVVVAVASGSTLGGMVAGFKLADQNDATTMSGGRRCRTLIGVEAYTIPKHDIVKNVLKIAKATAVHLGLEGSNITEKDFIVDDRFTGLAYGKLDMATKKTINEMAATEGILLDPVYSGKAATGMLDMARNDENFQRSNILFCHTGGQISLSAYAQEI